jgi:hypothetical protein
MCVNLVRRFSKNSSPAAARAHAATVTFELDKFMQVASQYNEVGGNGARPDFHRERHIIAVTSHNYAL